MIIEFGSHKVDFQPWRPEIGKVFTKTFAFDTETTLIDESHPWITPAFILGAACDGKRGYFVQRQHVADFLQAHNELQIAFHHAPFDLEVLQLVVGNGMDLYALVDANRVWDTMLLHRLFVLGSEGHTARNKGESTLETCVQTYLGLELPKDVVDSSGIPVRTSYSKWLNKQPRDIEPVYLEYLGKDVLATRLV